MNQHFLQSEAWVKFQNRSVEKSFTTEVRMGIFRNIRARHRQFPLILPLWSNRY